SLLITASGVSEASELIRYSSMIIVAGYWQQARGRVKERVMSSSAMTTIQQKDTLPRSVSSLPADAEMGEYDDGVSVFVRVRARLFGIAYRMLGSAAEAEDVVQDVWLRWQSTNRSAVENPPAFLATITTRLCINLIQSAHSRRETYTGTWLPEPVDTSSDPA